MGAGLIRRYDVYVVAGELFAVLQSELVDLETVVIAPLVPEARTKETCV